MQIENRPVPPSLEFAFTILANIEVPLLAGQGLKGERIHIPILSGEVSGPRLNGRIAPGGSDWPLLRLDGVSEIEAQYTIIAEDGTPLLVRNKGLRVSSAEVTKRLSSRDLVNPNEYYFRSSLVFDVPNGPHEWMRNRIFIASLMPRGSSISIDVYIVE
ncbi:DUF3237 family protein [Saccharospirillum sp.]|uniref:DUF3237 family protein n=1 Tax=Saccharospirillum sp. TaxID=2033801 RepID=UPI00349FE270